MKGDFSRNTFDPTKHFTRVLMQQGRVQVDADWNEQQAITETRIETEAADVIGGCGAPLAAPGFEITIPDGKQIQIGAGHFYVDGILCTNEAPVAYDAQPDYRLPPEVIGLLQKAKATLGIIYLDVWQRHITALDDARIREVALGGPDTATRLRTVWQVKVLPLAATSTPNPQALQRLQEERAAVQKQLDQLTQAGTDKQAIAEAQAKLKAIDAAIARLTRLPACAEPFDEWEKLIAPSSGTLNARTQKPEGEDNVCLLPPSAGYQRLENQLYRVEIHQGGPLGTATFKWSRDNGSVVTRIEKFNGQEITVHDVGPDDVLGFANDQWVEIVDDTSDLDGLPGQLAQIASVDPATRVITLKTTPSPVDPTQRPKLRRWDQTGTQATGTGIVTAAGWVALEGGIEVQFSAGTYATGDYWLIPARTATGEIEWPPFEVPNTAPVAQPPLGIRHHYCRLAVIQLSDGGLARRQDCRIIFPPLASPALHVIGTNWSNDDAFTLVQLAADGLVVTLDGTPDPATVDNDSMIVTVEMPSSQTGIQQQGVVPGTITVESNVITWRAPSASGQTTTQPGTGTVTPTTGGGTVVLQPGSGTTAPQPQPSTGTTTPQPGAGTTTPQPGGGAVSPLPGAVLHPNLPFPILVPHTAATSEIVVQPTYRVRVILKGHVIWGDFGDRRLYLDGQAFGLPGLRADQTTRRTALSFPTGNAARASDFESWFFLGPERLNQPLQVKSVGFIVSAAAGEHPSSAGTINVPPLPSQPVTFKAGENVNVVEITFTRPVSDTGIGALGQPQAIRIESASTPTAGGVRIAGELKQVQPGVVRFTARDPQIILKGNWSLVVQGNSSQTGPAVTAADNGAALDGDFNGQAGGDFVLPLQSV